MAVFSTNQVRQLYVAKALKNSVALTTAIGDVYLSTTTPDFYLIARSGLKEPVRSDLVSKNKVVSVSFTTGKTPKVRQYTVTVDSSALVDGRVPAGYNFILKIMFRKFVGISDQERLVKFGEVYTTSAMTPADFYAALAASINKNFKHENKIYPIIKVGDTTTNGVVLTEVMQQWKLGTMRQELLPFELGAETVTIDGVDVNWLHRDSTTGNVPFTLVNATDGLTGATLTNYHDIADLEYFCMGARGDQYRKIGWPNFIETNYLVNTDVLYDTIDIQYFYDGNAEDVQKSPKTLTIVSPTGVVTTATARAIAASLGLSKYFSDGVATATA